MAQSRDTRFFDASPTISTYHPSTYSIAPTLYVMFKPFKSPLIRPGIQPSLEPPVKRQKLDREPLHNITNPPEAEPEPAISSDGSEGYYNVLWRKFTTKKNKTWDDDGILVVKGGLATLLSSSGKELGRIGYAQPLLAGSTLSIAGRDVEVDSPISKADYMAGRSFLRKPGSSEQSENARADIKIPGKPPALNPDTPILSIKAQMKAQMLEAKQQKTLNISAPIHSKSAFKQPLKETTIMPKVVGKPVPRHNPDESGALVMKRPKCPKGKQIVDVVLDPILGKHLRKHQREGVKFLYECVMGLRDFDGQGCILADEMGLGKTLQTIALLWTLLKQNPIYESQPVIKKALIVCPVTLIENWKKEFRKWLGNERIGVFVADVKKTRLTDFTMGKSYNVMIIGYERLRTVAEDLAKGAGIDIVVCDEGHRLKTVANKSAQAISSLNTAKRIILSGTPIQNDLSEFFSMVNFVNDGLLGTHKQFTKNFEVPIVRSREANAISDHVELGESRSAELAQTTAPFILRRTADILNNYLPPKLEYVLFCDPTPTQANIYRHVVSSPMFSSLLGTSETAFQLITILKKLCNSPSLLSSKAASAEDGTNTSTISSLLASLPQGLLRNFGNQASTKIRILDQLLHCIRTRTDEKVVLVSNYTSTLDLLQTLLTSTGLPFLRLDGSTPSSKRHAIVEDFNRSSQSNCFAFLLSAKAGGMGLNLIGASRLVLFDVDWNPATDDQAMARIHREGQKRACRIYRFLVKGGLEERIWQRQVVKKGLADSILNGGAGSGGDKNGGVASFSREELRDLFRLDERAGLQTHDLIACLCDGSGVHEAATMKQETDNDDNDDAELPELPALIKASGLKTEDIEKAKVASRTMHELLMQYVHIDPRVAGMGCIDDECLVNTIGDQDCGVAYIFKKTSGGEL